MLDEGEPSDGETLVWYSPLNQDDAFGDNGYREEEFGEDEEFEEVVTLAPGEFPAIIMDDGSSRQAPTWSDWTTL